MKSKKIEQKNDITKKYTPPKILKRGDTFKRFCKVCQTKSIFNVTSAGDLVCSVCGVKKGGEPDEKTYKG